MLACGWSKCAVHWTTGEITQETHFPVRWLCKALPCLSDIGPACVLRVWTKPVFWDNHTWFLRPVGSWGWDALSLQIKCTCILKSSNSAREQKEIIREDRGTLGMSVLDGPGGEECGQGGREDLSRILDPT